MLTVISTCQGLKSKFPLRRLTSCCISISGKPQLRMRGAFSVVGWSLYCALCQAKPPSQERESGSWGGRSLVKAKCGWVEFFKDFIDTAMIRSWSMELTFWMAKLPISKVQVSPWRVGYWATTEKDTRWQCFEQHLLCFNMPNLSSFQTKSCSKLQSWRY